MTTIHQWCEKFHSGSHLMDWNCLRFTHWKHHDVYKLMNFLSYKKSFIWIKFKCIITFSFPNMKRPAQAYTTEGKQINCTMALFVKIQQAPIAQQPRQGKPKVAVCFEAPQPTQTKTCTSLPARACVPACRLLSRKLLRVDKMSFSSIGR